MNWGVSMNVPVALIIIPWALLVLPITALFRGWMVPRPFYQAEVAHRQQERVAKEDALAANKDLLEANTLLLRRDDLSITTLREIRDYIHRHDGAQATEGEGSTGK